MNKAYKFRLYPNTEQNNLFAKTFGCCRFVYNQLLDLQQENYKNKDKHISRMDTNKYCNRVIKVEYPFLKEVDKFTLTNAIYALETGFKKFLKNKAVFLSSRTSIAVVEATQPMSQEREGNYYCSFLFEYEEVLVAVAIQTVVGLDYKSNGLYMTSEGKECGSPKYYRKSQEKLAKAQRKLKQMQKHSCNYLKQQQKIARIYRQEANQRKDFLHKRSTDIANQYDLVCVESLNMRNLSNKGFGNGKATLDNGYGMFLTMFAYKLINRGKRFRCQRNAKKNSRHL